MHATFRNASDWGMQHMYTMFIPQVIVQWLMRERGRAFNLTPLDLRHACTSFSASVKYLPEERTWSCCHFSAGTSRTPRKLPSEVQWRTVLLPSEVQWCTVLLPSEVQWCTVLLPSEVQWCNYATQWGAVMQLCYLVRCSDAIMLLSEVQWCKFATQWGAVMQLFCYPVRCNDAILLSSEVQWCNFACRLFFSFCLILFWL